MAAIDFFNGDADGISALVQLRNAAPKTSQSVTGVKRDIALVDKLSYASGDVVTVLDVSFNKNRDGVEKALQAGANATANLYSLIETAKANKIQPYRYLRWEFTELPKPISFEEIEALVPDGEIVLG